MKHRPQGYLLGIASLVLLAGCSEPSADNRSSDPPSATATPETTRPGIPTSPPPIPRPLDAGKFRDKPCDMFTDEQARALGYPLEKSSGSVPEQSYCVRDDMSNLALKFSIWYRHDGTDRFAKVHRREEGWRADDAASITVDGQPAAKLPGANSCRVLIGLSTTESVEVVFGDPKVDSCERAVRIAEGVVRNVRG